MHSTGHFLTHVFKWAHQQSLHTPAAGVRRFLITRQCVTIIYRLYCNLCGSAPNRICHMWTESFDGERPRFWNTLRSSGLFISSSFFHLKRKWIGLSISLSEPPGNHMIRFEILCTPSLCSAKWVIEIVIECVAPPCSRTVVQVRGITYAAIDELLS